MGAACPLPTELSPATLFVHAHAGDRQHLGMIAPQSQHRQSHRNIQTLLGRVLLSPR